MGWRDVPAMNRLERNSTGGNRVRPLRALAKRLVHATADRIPVSKALHWAFFRDRITIVMYHGVVRAPLEVPDRCFVDEQSFIQQVEYLKRDFDVIPLSEVVDRLRNRQVRRPTAAITFDDGYQNNYDVAWPVLRAAGLPATIFLVTDLIDTDDMVWSCRLHRAVTETRKSEFEWAQSRFDLRGSAARAQAAVALKRRLKTLKPQHLAAELEAMLRALGDVPDRPAERESPFRMLNREAIIDMSHSGLIDFGAHTCSHPILSLLSESNCRREIAESVAAVAQFTGRSCTLFAYPNGRTQDYSARVLDAVAAAGIRTAVTTVTRPNDAETPALELGRYSVPRDMSPGDFQATVHHQLRRTA